ncbi:magnesium transporter CorA family protein [Pedococcus sp. NPDC057267]|uniref:magnesium transporter CorA family protein n=1 Tax=Pedococcus sp. NPDC057267 TaxID=3346077 RepID=UPI003635E908
MDVYVIDESGLTRRCEEELPELLVAGEGVVWIDIPQCRLHEADVLGRVFGFSEIALHDCVQRNHVSKIQAYDDHVFTVLHAPQLGEHGHVHYIELDQFMGVNYLVTIHGPLNPKAPPSAAFLDTNAVMERIEAGKFHPRTAFELSSAIISAMTRREIDMIASLAEQSGHLEKRVMSGEVMKDSEGFLTDLFQVWYELLAIRTIAVHSSATYDRMASLARFLPADHEPLVADLADRFEMVSSMADGQRESLHGVIEFFQTRVSTHLTIASDDLAQISVQQNDDMRKISAWVAIIAVPTAVTGFMGQNVPYPGFGTEAGFYASTTVMLVMAIALYVFFRRKDWL